MSAARRRRWPRRLLGLLLLLVVLELALEAAAPLVQRAMLRRPPTPSPDAPLTILCVGDSNTYGLYVPQWSYPAQLAARLQPRFAGPVAVVNRGVPGQSAAQVADALPADLRSVRPDLVLLLAGLNDAWNTAPGADGTAAWFGQLRLVRLVRVLLSGVASPGSFEVRSDESGSLLVDRGEGGQRVNVTENGPATAATDELRAAVRAGLLRCVEACRDFGAEPVLMSYAENGGTHSDVSAVARELAAELGVLFVDHERAFGTAFATEGHDALMFNEHHPNARGYALMAARVDEVLAAGGRVPPQGSLAGATVTEATDRPPPVQPALEALGAGRLRLTGPGGWSWQLAVARRPASGEAFRAGAVDVPLPSDDILARSRLEPSFTGRFGAEGQLEVAVPRWLQEAADGAALAACLVLLRDPGAAGEPVAAVSPAVEVEF